MALKSVIINVVVDNIAFSAEFKNAWGLSLHVKLIYDDSIRELLFDVSGDFDVWHHNAQLLNINPSSIDAVVISHWHSDHAGALGKVLELIGKQVPVYSPAGLRRWVVSKYNVIECSEGAEVLPYVYTTGSAGYLIAEHAAAIKVYGKGIVLLVGCSHPGLPHLVRRAVEVASESKVYLVIGGFHITSGAEGREVAEYLRSLGVKYVAPLHCTGREARSSIRQVFNEYYIEAGAGKIIEV